LRGTWPTINLGTKSKENERKAADWMRLRKIRRHKQEEDLHEPRSSALWL